MRETIKRGVGFIHEGTSDTDAELVNELFQCGAIQVCIVPHTMCYQIKMHAYLVIMMDTQYYNGKYHVYEDYPISDILHIVGLANRPNNDQDGRFIFQIYSFTFNV